MRRLVAMLALCTFTLAMFIPGGWITGTLAQQGTLEESVHPIVGTWRETATEEGIPPLALTTVFSAEGTIIGAGAPLFQLEPGVVIFIGPGTGVWEATGPNAVAYTVDLLLADAEGNPAGRQTVYGTREVSADGQTFTGEYTYTVSDPAGTLLFSSGGMDEGTRLIVEPMPIASPEATPAT